MLKKAREEKRRKKEEQDNRTKWNRSAGVSNPAGEKEEMKKNEGGEKSEQMKLDPQNKIMVKQSNRLSNKRQRTKI